MIKWALVIAASFTPLTPALAQTEPKTAPAQIAVSTSGQSGGATVGNVGTFNQMILPTLVRGPQLARFKDQFTLGARLLRTMRTTEQTDNQIDSESAAFGSFAEGTFGWLRKDVSEYAAERFAFITGRAISYNLGGTHKPGYPERWSNTIVALEAYLGNLDTLMRDPSIYPDCARCAPASEPPQPGRR